MRDGQLHTPSQEHSVSLGGSSGEESCDGWMLSSYSMWVIAFVCGKCLWAAVQHCCSANINQLVFSVTEIILLKICHPPRKRFA